PQRAYAAPYGAAPEPGRGKVYDSEPAREHGSFHPDDSYAPRLQEPSRGQEFSSSGNPSHQSSPPHRKDLLAPEVDAAVAAAFGSLGDLVMPAHERTLEGLVKEMLRPMLKTWLDDNLPRLVEDLVRQEIERISRKSR
ncbi:MAG: DUF2497 domain-containing protein, partial [Pseudomonadota bacterium]